MTATAAAVSSAAAVPSAASDCLPFDVLGEKERKKRKKKGEREKRSLCEERRVKSDDGAERKEKKRKSMDGWMDGGDDTQNSIEAAVVNHTPIHQSASVRKALLFYPSSDSNSLS